MWYIATLCAYFIKGLCGFSDAILFSTMLSFTTDNIYITPVALLLGSPANMLMVWKKHKYIKAKIVLPIICILLIGSCTGVYLIKFVNPGKAKVFFGIAITLLGLNMLFNKNSNKKKPSKILTGSIGIMSGILSGMFGIGALLAVYVNKVTDSVDEFKGNLCSILLVEGLFRFAMYIKVGIITMATFKRAVVLYPLMLTGFFLGLKSSSILDEKIVKKIIIIMFIVSGINIVIMNMKAFM